jgi:hypothetical protein
MSDKCLSTRTLLYVSVRQMFLASPFPWLYYIKLYYTILYYTILYYTILYHTIPYYTILYYTILYYTILYYTILYYTILLLLYKLFSSFPDAEADFIRINSSKLIFNFGPIFLPLETNITLSINLKQFLLIAHLWITPASFLLCRSQHRILQAPWHTTCATTSL